MITQMNVFWISFVWSNYRFFVAQQKGTRNLAYKTGFTVVTSLSTKAGCSLEHLSAP